MPGADIVYFVDRILAKIQNIVCLAALHNTVDIQVFSIYKDLVAIKIYFIRFKVKDLSNLGSSCSLYSAIKITVPL